MPTEGEIKYDDKGNTLQYQNGQWVMVQRKGGQHVAMVIPVVTKETSDKDKKPRK